jgi:hypothetical protein
MRGRRQPDIKAEIVPKGMPRALRPIVLLLASQATLYAAFPKPQGSVNDFGGILQDGAKAGLTALLRDTRDQTSAEIPFLNASRWTLGVLAVGVFAWGYAKGRSSSWFKALGRGPRSLTSDRWVPDRNSSSSSGGSSDSFSGGSSGGAAPAGVGELA